MNEAAGEWVSVRDSLPEEECSFSKEEFLVWREGFKEPENNGFDIQTFQRQALWFTIRQGRDFGITHWARLVKPDGWSRCPHLPGYEQRTNPQGFLETRRIGEHQ